MTKHQPPEQFKSHRQLDRSIAEAARSLIEAVRARIDANKRVNSSLIACIKIDHGFVGVSFIDYPDEFMDLVEWRKR